MTRHALYMPHIQIPHVHAGTATERDHLLVPQNQSPQRRSLTVYRFLSSHTARRGPSDPGIRVTAGGWKMSQ